MRAPQPWRALVLLRQSKARRYPAVAAEKPQEKFRAIAFLAPMQQHNVIRQPTRAVEKFADGSEGLRIGKVTAAAGDAALQEPWAGAIGLHLRIVIALQRDAIQIAEAVEEVGRT